MHKKILTDVWIFGVCCLAITEKGKLGKIINHENQWVKKNKNGELEKKKMQVM